MKKLPINLKEMETKELLFILQNSDSNAKKHEKYKWVQKIKNRLYPAPVCMIYMVQPHI